ncbi:hypothetical protein MKEN_00121900 [Mycena kentingensis (nom. inval.)]|nr:hypothetical protein MKEN_00121900 [Mycena kentingensis (nom. inval.)]
MDPSRNPQYPYPGYSRSHGHGPYPTSSASQQTAVPGPNPVPYAGSRSGVPTAPPAVAPGFSHRPGDLHPHAPPAPAGYIQPPTGPPPPVNPSKPSVASIHDEASFQFTANQIFLYIRLRVNSQDFISPYRLVQSPNGGPSLSKRVPDPSRQALSDFMLRCIRQRTCRVRVKDDRTSELTTISVNGRFGLRFMIADFYTALAFVISETDQYSYTNNEDDITLCLIHLKILAFYINWIVAISVYFTNDKSGPNTACIMYRRDPTNKLVMGIFPNLAQTAINGFTKELAREVVQKSLTGAYPNLDVRPPSPSQSSMGMPSVIGSCAEILALLYLLQSQPAGLTELRMYGMAANVDARLAQRTWASINLVVDVPVKAACSNCRSVLNHIDDDLTRQRPSVVAQNPLATTFAYHDWGTVDIQQGTSIPAAFPDTEDKRCGHCQVNRADHKFQCEPCKLLRYCSERCRLDHWDTHAFVCAAYFRCASKGCGHTSLYRGKDGRIYTWSGAEVPILELSAKRLGGSQGVL